MHVCEITPRTITYDRLVPVDLNHGNNNLDL